MDYFFFIEINDGFVNNNPESYKEIKVLGLLLIIVHPYIGLKS